MRNFWRIVAMVVILSPLISLHDVFGFTLLGGAVVFFIGGIAMSSVIWRDDAARRDRATPQGGKGERDG